MTITELEECIDIFGKDIYGFCRQLTGSVQEGEDLYQDTFLKAVELKDKIDKNQNPKSYLVSIAVRLWKNRRRKYAWRKRIADCERVVEEAALEQYGGDSERERPEEAALIREERTLVVKCVAALEEKYRLPVYLYYSAELSLNEIAQILKLPEGTVKSRLYKARKIIREEMEANGYDR